MNKNFPYKICTKCGFSFPVTCTEKKYLCSRCDSKEPCVLLTDETQHYVILHVQPIVIEQEEQNDNNGG